MPHSQIFNSRSTNVEEPDVVYGVLELICQLLLASWSVELRQVQCDKIGPLHYNILVRRHHRIELSRC